MNLIPNYLAENGQWPSALLLENSSVVPRERAQRGTCWHAHTQASLTSFSAVPAPGTTMLIRARSWMRADVVRERAGGVPSPFNFADVVTTQPKFKT